MSKIMKSNTLSNGQVSAFPLEEVFFEKGKKSTSDENIEEAVSKIKREAYEEGFSRGEAAGRLVGLKKLEPIEKISLKIIDEVRTLKTLVLKETEEDILLIVLAIARHIVGEEIKVNPTILLDTIQKGIKKMGQTEKLVVRLHPDDLETITQDTDFVHPFKENSLSRLEADPHLLPGDCIVEGQERVVDARPKSQLHIFEEMLIKKQ